MVATILFADDDAFMHQLYQQHLERAGYRFIGATNGRESVQAVVREAPQLILMDIMMPEVDGLTAITELKTQEATKTIPIVVMTSNPSLYSCRSEFAATGAAAFLTKPFGPSQLLQAISRVLGYAQSLES